MTSTLQYICTLGHQCGEKIVKTVPNKRELWSSEHGELTYVIMTTSNVIKIGELLHTKTILYCLVLGSPYT